MAKQPHQNLSRRERQIMDVVYNNGEATVAHVHKQMPDPPSYTTVRTLMRLLEEKGHLKHKQDGPRYVYMPTLPREQASESALKQILGTFFNGSPTKAVAALLEQEELSNTELDELDQLLADARKKGR